MRTVSYSETWLEDLLAANEQDGGILGDYVCVEEGPFEALLREEVYRLPRIAHLTKLQSRAFRFIIADGLSLSQAASAMECTVPTVRAHLLAAISRAKRVKGLGAFTTIIETFGWRGARDVLYNPQNLPSKEKA